jgi:transcription elongation factor Elf1
VATSIIGYPLVTDFCPACGSSDIETRDQWDQDGLMVCNKCGCRCYIIAAEEE